MDIIKANPDELAEAYFEKIATQLQTSSSTFNCLKIAHRYFKERKVTHRSSLPQFADKLEQNHQLLQLIIEDINKYTALVNAKIQEEMTQAEA